MWPYPNDATYFRLLAHLSGITALVVFCIEAYAVWFVVFAKNDADSATYGIKGGCLMLSAPHDEHFIDQGSTRQIFRTQDIFQRETRLPCLSQVTAPPPPAAVS
jgi:hypothetical protein